MKSFSPIPFNPRPFPHMMDDAATPLQLSGEAFSGYYVSEDLFSNATTADLSPMMSSHPSFASSSTIRSEGTSPLWQEGQSPRKVVGRCLNCNHKFYARGGKVDFCSKDCETCYVMFNKSGQYCKKMKSVEEIRRSIFEFQKELDQQSNVPLTVTTPVAPATPKKVLQIIHPKDLSEEIETEEIEATRGKAAWATNALYNFTALLTSPTRKKQQQ